MKRLDSDLNLPLIERSDAWFQRARDLIPAYTQTLAKGPTQYVFGVAPKYLSRGAGCHVWDVDENEYIDLTMAVGPLSLGYTYAAVDRAIAEQLARGITFTLMHPLEVEVAELVRAAVPRTDSVRFSKTGADVTSAAVRIARAFTKRDRVVCCGYHGWHDWYAGTLPLDAGVPTSVKSLTRAIAYNDVDGAADAIDDTVACVVVEPSLFEEPKNDFLGELRHACDRYGALLVFDEMWTGFRLALGGAQEFFGVEADLACFSKAVANGMPLSVLTGRRAVMSLLENDVFFYTTFGGEALSLAAAKATLHELREHDVISHLARQGRRLREGYNALARELDLDCTRAVGFDCRSMITFGDREAATGLEMKSLVQQSLLAEGVLWAGFHNVSYAHDDQDVARVLDAYRVALGTLADALRKGDVRGALRGEPVRPVFRRHP